LAGDRRPPRNCVRHRRTQAPFIRREAWAKLGIRPCEACWM